MTGPLANFDRQKVFDTMLKHLREQQVPATTEFGSCRYRTPGGLKCAVGILIPDEIYQPKFEDGSCFEEIAETLGVVRSVDVGFLRTCQKELHDFPSIQCDINNPDGYLPEVENGAMKVARQFSLIYTPPESVGA